MEGRKEQLSKTIQIKISDLALNAPHPSDIPPAQAADARAHQWDLSKYGISFDCVYDAVFVTDELGTIIDVNGKATELFLHSAEDLRFKNIRELLLGFDGPVMFQVVQNVRNGKRVLVEAFGLRRDDSTFPSETAVTRVTLGTEENLLCFFIRNVIHHKQAEEAMRMAQIRMARAERLEAAGMVAGQIAHDFNNLLTPLLGYPALIRRLLPKESPVMEFVDVMENTAKDMAHLTEQLLCLSRRGRMAEEELFAVNEVVNQTLTLLRADLPPGLTVRTELEPDLMSIKGSRDQVGRVLHNLCRNAADAMGESGTLAVRTENVYLESPLRGANDFKAGEYVQVSVQDTGPGIPEEIREKMFDPFFTTKRASKRRGSGLGLSIVMGIVKDHNGYLDFETETGRGTTFRIFLPIHREEAKADGAQPAARETVLLMDDDALQVELIAQMLGSLGYRVTGCRSGEEAVMLVKTGKCKPDLALLDVLVPGGMDGAEAMRRLRAIQPDLPVVLISGMPAGEALAAREEETPFLRKPITVERLAQEIRALLDHGSAADGGAAPPRGILIVDDEEPMRKLFHLILHSEYPDIRIDQAANGREAVAKALSTQPQVIVMDCQMPVADGVYAFESIRAEFQQRGWPLPAFLFCTGFTLPEALRKVVAEDSRHAYLPKPIQAEALIEETGRRLKGR